MKEYSVISKGKCINARNGIPVRAEKYVIASGEDGERFLLLRLSNTTGMPLDGVRVRIFQFSRKGVFLGEADADADGLFAGKEFTVETRVGLQPGCARIKIMISSASFGRYSYGLRSDGTAVLSYDGDCGDTAALSRGSVSAPQSVTSLRKSNKYIAVLLTLILVALLVIAGTCLHLVYVNGNAKGFYSDRNYYSFMGGNEVVLTKYRQKNTEVFIPAETEGYKVVGIGEHAFEGKKKITGVEFEGTVEIADYAFSGCVSLSQVNFENVTYIGDGAFRGCSSLTSFECGDISHIGDGAFESSGLVTVSVDPDGSGVYLGSRAFADCTSLSYVYVGENVTYSPDGDVFAGCPQILTAEFVSLTARSGYGSVSRLMGIGNEPYGPAVVRQLTIDSLDEIGDDFCRDLEVSSVYIFSLDSSSVGDYAFYGCWALSVLSLPVPLTRIGDYAFCGCGLSSSEYDLSAVTYIGDYAFSGTQLTSLDLSAAGGLTYVGEGAFAYCTDLCEVVLPASLSRVPDWMFLGCTSLTDVSVPDGVNEIGTESFMDCRLMSVPNLDGVKYIGDRAFYGCAGYTPSLSLGSVVRIGEEAFGGCNIGGEIFVSSAAEEIGYGAFSGWDGTSLTVPFTGGSHDGNGWLGYIFGAPVFRQNSLYVPSSLTYVTVTGDSISDYAFYDLGGISTVIMQDVKTVGNYAFYGCSSLRNLSGTCIESIEDYAFFGCGYCTDIGSLASLEYIGDWAFSGDNWYRVLVIPSSVTYIGLGAFEGWDITYLTAPFAGGSASENTYLGYIFGASSYSESSSYVPRTLTDVTVTGTSLGAYAFYGCSNIRTIDIRYMSSTSIPSYAFYGCSSLQSLVTGTVTSIEDYAFVGCNLETSLVIPQGITSIGLGAFEGWDITYLTVPFAGGSASENTYLGYIFGASSYSGSSSCVPRTLTSVTVTGTSLGAYAFYGCSNIITIDIRSMSSTSIPSYAFYGCSSLQSLVTGTVTSIGDYAFAGCNLETSLVISQDITSIGRGAFEGWDITYLTVPFAGGSASQNTYLGYIFGASSYSRSSSYVPQTLTSVTVTGTSLGAYAFYECSSLKSVDIANMSSTSIPSYAFYGCSSLQSLVTGTVTSIEDYAFAGCNLETSLVIPQGITSIGLGAFSGWDITYLTVPFAGGSVSQNTYLGYIFGASSYSRSSSYVPQTLTSVTVTGTSLGTYAFYGCSSLKSVDISSVTEIGAYAFYGCTGLTSMSLGASLTVIGNCAFYGCTSLEGMVFPSSLTEIGTQAFYGCSSLRYICVESFLYVGTQAFYGCSSLYDIYNFSTMEMSIRSTMDGYIAYYARFIHTESEDLAVYTGDGPLLFAEVGGKYYLVAVTDGSDSTVTLPDSINGMNYSVNDRAFYGLSSVSLVIPVSVTGISDNAFDGDGVKKIYYCGDASQWASVFGGQTSAGIYFYVSCVHGDSQWTYAPDGSIRDETAYTVTVSYGATCLDEDTEICSCSVCGEVLYEIGLGTYGAHSYGSDGLCIYCGKKSDSASIAMRYAYVPALCPGKAEYAAVCGRILREGKV